MRQGQLLGNRGSNHVHKLVFDKCVVPSIKANDCSAVCVTRDQDGGYLGFQRGKYCILVQTITDSTEQISSVLMLLN